MSDAQPRRPMRQPGPARARHGRACARLAARLVPPLAAVGAVSAVIGLLLFVNGRGGSPTTGPAVAASSAPRSTSTTRARPRPASPPSGPAATSPGAAHATTRPAVTKLPVTVLNNSRITGLAHDAARELERRGWPVADIGNLTGRIRTTTIYYAPGQYVVARAFARQFTGVRRILPRFPDLPGAGLTLVVTRYWPRGSGRSATD